MSTLVYWSHLCVTWTSPSQWELMEPWWGISATLEVGRGFYPYLYFRLCGLQASLWR